MNKTGVARVAEQDAQHPWEKKEYRNGLNDNGGGG